MQNKRICAKISKSIQGYSSVGRIVSPRLRWRIKRAKDLEAVERIQEKDAAASRSILRVPRAWGKAPGGLQNRVSAVYSFNSKGNNFNRLYRGIAQLVEQRSPKPRVQSSSLCAPAKEKVRKPLILKDFRAFSMLYFVDSY